MDHYYNTWVNDIILDHWLLHLGRNLYKGDFDAGCVTPHKLNPTVPFRKPKRSTRNNQWHRYSRLWAFQNRKICKGVSMVTVAPKRQINHSNTQKRNNKQNETYKSLQPFSIERSLTFQILRRDFNEESSHTHTHIFPMQPFTSTNTKACTKAEYKHLGPSPPHCFWKENFI